MGPIKYWYIHYEKASDQFVGRYIAGISSLIKDSVISPVHLYWEDSPSNLKYKVETLTEYNLVRRTYVSGPTFDILKYLFAFICFHYEHLDAHLHPKHRLRSSPIYIASGREKDLHKCAVIRYPWLSTNYTPCATGIPPHVMLIAEIEVLKADFEREKTHTLSIIWERNSLLEMLVGTYIEQDVFWTKSKLLVNHSWETFKIYQVQIQGNTVKLSKIPRITFFKWSICSGERGGGVGRSYQSKYPPCGSYRSQ